MRNRKRNSEVKSRLATRQKQRKSNSKEEKGEYERSEGLKGTKRPKS